MSTMIHHNPKQNLPTLSSSFTSRHLCTQTLNPFESGRGQSIRVESSPINRWCPTLYIKSFCGKFECTGSYLKYCRWRVFIAWAPWKFAMAQYHCVGTIFIFVYLCVKIMMMWCMKFRFDHPGYSYSSETYRMAVFFSRRVHLYNILKI